MERRLGVVLVGGTGLFEGRSAGSARVTKVMNTRWHISIFMVRLAYF
jgi:hypothetical protein